MARVQGMVEQVETIPARAQVVEDAAISDTVLQCGNVGFLLTLSGVCTVDINGVQYTATPDPTEDTVTVSPALSEAVAGGDWIVLTPAAQVKVAWVSSGEDDTGDLMLCRVTASLVPKSQFRDGPKDDADPANPRTAVIVETEPEPVVTDFANGPSTHDATTEPIVVTTENGETVRIDGDGITTFTDDPIPVRTITGVTAHRLAIAGDYLFISGGSAGLRKFNILTGMESLSGFPKTSGQPYSHIASDGTNVFAVDSASDIRSFDAVTGTEDLTGFPIAGTFAQLAASGGRLFAVDSAGDIRSYDAATGTEDTTNFPKTGTYTWLAASGGRLFAVDSATLDIHSFDASTGVEDVVNFPLVGSYGQLAASNGVLYAVVGAPVKAFDAITGVEDTTNFPVDMNAQGVALAAGSGYLASDSGWDVDARIVNIGSDYPSVRIDSSDGTAQFHAVSVTDISVAGNVDVSGPAEIPQLQVYSTRYTRTTNQSIGTNTITAVTYTANDGTEPDNAGLSESSGVVTVAEAGVYRVTAVAGFASVADSARRETFIYINGAARTRANTPGINGSNTYPLATDDIPLAAGATVEMRVRHNSTGNINIIEAALTITRIGALAA